MISSAYLDKMLLFTETAIALSYLLWLLIALSSRSYLELAGLTAVGWIWIIVGGAKR